MANEGHETKDVPVKWLALGVLGFIVSMIGTIFLVRLYFNILHGYTVSSEPPVAPRAMVLERKPPPPPRLQLDAAADWDAYRNEQDKLLKGYGWIDPKQGIARIPIDRAMEILSSGAQGNAPGGTPRGVK